MRRFAAILIALFVSLLLTECAYAESPEAELIEVERLEEVQPDEAREAYGILKADDVSDVQVLLRKLWQYLSGQEGDLTASALHSGAEILLISFLSELCCAASKSKMMPLIGPASVAMVCVKSISSCAEIGRQALRTLADYSHVLLPCLSTAAAAGGAWTSSGVKYAASTLMMDVMITAEQNAVLPLLYAYIAAIITAQMTENELLMSVTGLVKQIVKWALLLLTICFSIYLSVTGILSGTVDAAAAKAAKTVISSTLPVVGGILSDASGAILSGVQMLRNGIGIIGMLVILAVCVCPYLTLGSHYLVYQIVGGAASSFGDKRIGGVIKGLGDAFGFLLGVVGCASVMLFVSVISLMKAVTPL